jgi:serine/threonine protein kinase
MGGRRVKRTINLRAGNILRTVDSANEYRVIDHIGTGGNSVVLAAVVTRGPLQGALVAFRVFLQLDDAKRMERFQKEAEFLREQKHPAIVSVLEIGSTRIASADGVQEHPYQVQKLFGAPLSVALRTDVPMVYKVLWTVQLLSALRHLASLEDWVVHRDIKPPNIFIDGTTAVLADFGMMKYSKEFSAASEDDNEILRTKMPKRYRTPELVEYLTTGKPPSPKSDVFQLGLVVGEMFFKFNPLKDGDIDSPIELALAAPGKGDYQSRIFDLMQRMLVISSDDREGADSLLDDWDGVLHSIADDYTKLEGRVIPRRW